MATNLRLSDTTAEALREAAVRTGRSQQDLLREAIDTFLGLGEHQTPRDTAVAAGLVNPPTPFEDVAASISLKGTLTTLELLDRDTAR